MLFTAASLFFASCDKNKTTPNTAQTVVNEAASTTATGMTASKIAYVNIDSLQDQYTYFKQQKAIFEQKEKSLSASLEGKMQQFQKEYTALQEKAQTGTVPPAQLQEQGQMMQQKQQALVAERDRRSKDLIDETQKFNEELMKKINNVLSILQKEKGYDYVVRHTKESGSPFLYVNEKWDITNEVVKILNSEKK